MADKKKLPGGPGVGGNPRENAHGPSTTGSSTSVAQAGIGNKATAQGMGLGAPLQFGEAQPFSYFPGEALDVVYPTFGAGTEAIATMLYGDRALAGQLEPTDGPRGPGYRFDPGLLESEWRSVYYQHLATQAGRREQDELQLDGMLLLGAPGSEDIFSVIAPRPKESHYEAVVVYLPAALPQLGGLGQNPGSPSITMGGVSAPGPALRLTPVQQGEQPAHTRDAYDPRTHYGPSVGALSDISNHPSMHRTYSMATAIGWWWWRSARAHFHRP